MFQAINASGSGLTTARKWMKLLNNIVNANTTAPGQIYMSVVVWC